MNIQYWRDQLAWKKAHAKTQIADTRNLVATLSKQDVCPCDVPVVFLATETDWGGFSRLDTTKIAPINFLLLKVVEACIAQREGWDERLSVHKVLEKDNPWISHFQGVQQGLLAEWTLDMLDFVMEELSDPIKKTELISQAQVLGTDRFPILTGRTPAGTHLKSSVLNCNFKL